MNKNLEEKLINILEEYDSKLMLNCANHYEENKDNYTLKEYAECTLNDFDYLKWAVGEDKAFDDFEKVLKDFIKEC